MEAPSDGLLAPAVTSIEPAGKVTFVYRCMQTRLMVKGRLSLVHVSKPLITAITGIESEEVLTASRRGPQPYLYRSTQTIS